MGISTHIYGVVNLEVKFEKMMKVKESCDSAGVEYPQSLLAYIKKIGGHPDELVSTLRKEAEHTSIEDATRIYTEDYSDITEIDLSKLPKEVVKIRIVRNY